MAMNHRGIEFTVAKTALPGIWQWQFRIGEQQDRDQDRSVGDPAGAAAHRSGAEGDRAQRDLSGRTEIVVA
jgi:hypothetical protein